LDNLSETQFEQEVEGRRAVGMGIAGRFTLLLGFLTILFAAPATLLLIQGGDRLVDEAVTTTRLEMAKETGAIRNGEYTLPRKLSGRQHQGPDNVRVQVAEAELSGAAGSRQVRVYRVIENSENSTREDLDLFAPMENDTTPGEKFLVQVLLVTAGLVVMVILLSTAVSKRIARPLRLITEDVLAISRGNFNRRIRTSGSGEVEMLGWAVERMVDGLLDGQENQLALEKRQREADTLREIRRNLQPMKVAAPVGFSLATTTIESSGAGTGDFADALSDGDGRPTLLVGATAKRGMSGAMLMAMTRAYLRVGILEGQSPTEACDRANLALNRDLARGLYASAIISRLDPSSGEIELVSAGHKAPAIRWDAAAGQFRKLQPNGIALGFDKGPIFRKSLETLKLSLAAGDALFLYSPSVVDETNSAGNKKLGEAGLVSLAKLAIQDGLEAMEEKLRSYVGDSPKSDLAFALCKAEPLSENEN